MITRSPTFIKVTRHVPDPAVDGNIITYVTPVGTRVLKSFDLQEWTPVGEASPFSHTGGDGYYLLECFEYLGIPINPSLSIT